MQHLPLVISRLTVMRATQDGDEMVPQRVVAASGAFRLLAREAYRHRGCPVGQVFGGEPWQVRLGAYREQWVTPGSTGWSVLRCVRVSQRAGGHPSTTKFAPEMCDRQPNSSSQEKLYPVDDQPVESSTTGYLVGWSPPYPQPKRSRHCPRADKRLH